MFVIALINQKGGVGKSTTTVNLGAALAQLGRSVLVIDLDPQGTATIAALGADRNRPGSAEALEDVDPPNIADLAVPVPAFGFDLLSSNADRLTARSERIAADSTRAALLADAVTNCSKPYDLVLIDCPPNLGLLTVSGLYASDGLIVPIDAAGESLDGVALLKNTITRARRFRADLRILGAVITRINERAGIDQDVAEAVKADEMDGRPTFPFVSKTRLSTEFKKAYADNRPITTVKHPAADDIRRLALTVDAAVQATIAEEQEAATS